MSEMEYLLMLGGVMLLFFIVLFRQLAYDRPRSYMMLTRSDEWLHQPLPKARPAHVNCLKCDNGRMLPVRLTRVDVDRPADEGAEQGKRHAGLIPQGLGYLCDQCGSLYLAA